MLLSSDLIKDENNLFGKRLILFKVYLFNTIFFTFCKLYTLKMFYSRDAYAKKHY